MQTSFKMWFKFKNVVHTIITDTLHLLFLTILLGYPFNVNVYNTQAMDYYASTFNATAAPTAPLKITATSFKTTAAALPQLIKAARAGAAVHNADNLFLLRTRQEFLKETTTTNLTTHHLPDDNDSNKISSLYEDDNDGPDGLMMMKDYIMTKHITSHVNVAATTRTRTATTKTTRTKTPETAATATAEAAATATTTTTTITRTTKTTMKPIILSTTATTLMSNNLMPLRTYFNNKNHIKNLSSLSLLSINETTSLTLPSYYSSSYTSLPSSSLSSSSSSSSSSLANAIALRLNGNPGNVNSNRSRLFAGTSNNATIVTAIALKSTMPTKIANSISNSNNYDPSNSTISSALGSISLSNVNGNDTKTINNSSSSRSSSSSSSSSNSNIVTRVSARKVDSKYTLPKSHKTDAPMLNYIFDTFSSANKHHHHDQRYGPHFEDVQRVGQPTNLTVQAGSSIHLNCRISLLQDKTVSWVRRNVQGENALDLLTVGLHTYTGDKRYKMEFQYPHNWRLKITNVKKDDEATYECQISTHPPRVIQINLHVNAPKVMIVDEFGDPLQEKYYEIDSTLQLSCMVRNVAMSSSVVFWKHGEDVLNYDVTRGGVSVKTELMDDGANSTLFIAKINKSDSGNYSCSINEYQNYTIMVHILNGESFAELHHGSANSWYSANYQLLLINLILLIKLILCWPIINDR